MAQLGFERDLFSASATVDLTDEATAQSFQSPSTCDIESSPPSKKMKFTSRDVMDS
jgi:hypothetical protein